MIRPPRSLRSSVHAAPLSSAPCPTSRALGSLIAWTPFTFRLPIVRAFSTTPRDADRRPALRARSFVSGSYFIASTLASARTSTATSCVRVVRVRGCRAPHHFSSSFHVLLLLTAALANAARALMAGSRAARRTLACEPTGAGLWRPWAASRAHLVWLTEFYLYPLAYFLIAPPSPLKRSSGSRGRMQASCSPRLAARRIPRWRSLD